MAPSHTKFVKVTRLNPQLTGYLTMKARIVILVDLKLQFEGSLTHTFSPV